MQGFLLGFGVVPGDAAFSLEWHLHILLGDLLLPPQSLGFKPSLLVWRSVKV